MEQKRISNRFRRDKCKPVDFDDVVSLAQQQFAAECDVNNIIEKYKRTGVLVDPLVQSGRRPEFGDFTGIDYQVHANRVAVFNSAFERLPSKVRAKFDNSPEKLVAFLADDKNEAACIELGLIEKPVEVPKVDDKPPVKPAGVMPEIKPAGV